LINELKKLIKKSIELFHSLRVYLFKIMSSLFSSSAVLSSLLSWWIYPEDKLKLLILVFFFFKRAISLHTTCTQMNSHKYRPLNTNKIIIATVPHLRNDCTSVSERTVVCFKMDWNGTKLIKKISQVDVRQASPIVLDMFPNVLL